MTVRFKPYTVSGIVRLYLKKTGPTPGPAITNLLIIHLELPKVHPEMKTPFTQHLLDLSQRLLTKIAELHQVFLLIRDQLAETVDLGSFQTIEGANREIEIFQRSLQDLPQL